MCMFFCLCVCVCVFVCVCVCGWVGVCVWVYVCVCVCGHVYVCLSNANYKYVCMFSCMILFVQNILAEQGFSLTILDDILTIGLFN